MMWLSGLDHTVTQFNMPMDDLIHDHGTAKHYSHKVSRTYCPFHYTPEASMGIVVRGWFSWQKGMRPDKRQGF
jgi:hypothetical protein